MTTRTSAGGLLASTARFAALLAAATLGATLLAPAGPAAAHPFGPPSTADLNVDGTDVELVWRAAEDDWVALGQSLGAFEDPTTGPVDVTLTGEQKLQRSTKVHDYLLQQFSVSQAGQSCTGSLAALEQLLARGARLTFTCPAPVTELEVTLRALTDLNPAYRTMLTAAAQPAQALFTSSEPTHHLRLDPNGNGPNTAVATAAVGTGIAAVGILAFVLLRRRAGRPS